METANYIPSKIDFLASQYKESTNLKALLMSNLEAFEKPFFAMEDIVNVLDLETATGKNLELIGKIVGVNRSYCGDFGSTLNYSIQARITPVTSIEEVTLDDRCLRKLIEIKIKKNSKKIVNYKELASIFSTFFERNINIRSCGDFAIYVDVGLIEKEYANCLILLRAFIPLPPTIKLYYVEDITTNIQDTARVTLSGNQIDEVMVQTPPKISVILIDKQQVTLYAIQSSSIIVGE